MENIQRMGYAQLDKPNYLELSHAGVVNYEKLYAAGLAENKEGERTGIPADDFNIFATTVFACKDNRARFEAIRSQGRKVRHIDGATGPNIYSFIATLPYIDEAISIDLAPANVERLQSVINPNEPLAPHWQAWLEIGEILYDIGNADTFISLDRGAPELYDTLRNWPNLNETEKDRTRCDIYSVLRKNRSHDNPYADINLQEELSTKLQPRQGDLLNNVETFEELCGTADIVTSTFFLESVTNQPEIAAQALENLVELGTTDALVITAHMSKTTGYNGYYTREELASKPRLLEELPATSAFFETVVGKVVDLSDRYTMLWKVLEESPDHRKMVRETTYGGAVILCGTANHTTSDGNLRYRTGSDLLGDVENPLRRVDVTVIDESNTLPMSTLYCTGDETAEVARELNPSGGPRLLFISEAVTQQRHHGDI